jgi:uncharacterized protein YbcI
VFLRHGPTTAKSYIFDDLLLIVMRGGFTTAERTMLEFGHGTGPEVSANH